MRIRRQHDQEHQPVWTPGKPVWSEVRIGAPTASDLVERDEAQAPHAA